ncbi:SpaH/EbpB family LPXTG-anchored major pilin [Leifsonia sp. NPDC056824]|uniref:SpaH/EbpB family LPXTG-anchored major pilin n=1 Tax=Leifsonia sp. NPDC056824 TaxID=3345953 RepID=UPI0036AA70DD
MTIRRLTAAIGVGAVALLGAAAFAGPASADTTGGNAPAGPYTLTITKLQNPPGGGTPTDGTAQTSGLTPIPGVVFSVAPVNGVDLTTPAGWTTAAGLTVNSAGRVVGGGTSYTTGATTALPATGGSGITSYTTSTPAVYEVTETSAPAGTELGAPFLVTLPLPQGGNWLTNVFVYPKNTVEGAPVKAVDDTGAYGVGASVTWRVASTVPNQVAGNAFTQYSLTDPLDARLTPPTPGSVTVSLASSTGAAIALPAADYTVGVAGQTVTVDFTASGLALLTANPGAVVTATIPTVIGTVGSGTIQNIADQTISTQTGTTVTTPSNPVQDTWGDVSLHKVDPNGKALAGAQFQVFTSPADAQNLSNPVAVNGATTFTSDASGAVAIDGLKAQNDGAGADLTYYLVETQAPAGYTIAPAFAQAAGGYAETVAPGAANPTVTVTDPQAPPIALPLTGSTGTTVFVVGGLALAALAVAAAVLVVRRRTREEGPAA